MVILGIFLVELTLLRKMNSFFQKLESSLELQSAERNFSDNSGHNILELCSVLVQVWFATSKMKIDLSYNELGIWVVSQFAKGLKT